MKVIRISLLDEVHFALKAKAAQEKMYYNEYVVNVLTAISKVDVPEDTQSSSED